jgi:hypothetical protein
VTRSSPVEAPALTATLVGNDVVDLRDPEARGKAMDARFIARILDPAELDPCTGLLDDSLLWQIWSAKEAAHKVITKAFGESATPRSLRVEADGPWADSPRRGWVRWSDARIPVRWSRDAERVHCVAWWSAGTPEAAAPSVECRVESADHPSLRTATLTSGEASTARNQHSAAVRALARDMIDAGDEDARAKSRPEILRAVSSSGYGPPALWRDGERMAGHDLSLSHHGRYVAVALWRRHPSLVGSSAAHFTESPR